MIKECNRCGQNSLTGSLYRVTGDILCFHLKDLGQAAIMGISRDHQALVVHNMEVSLSVTHIQVLRTGDSYSTVVHLLYSIQSCSVKFFFNLHVLFRTLQPNFLCEINV